MFSQLRKLQIILGIRTTLLFIVVFYGCDQLTQLRQVSNNVSTGVELNIPYLESAFIIYYSVFLLPILVGVYLKDLAQTRLLERKLNSAIIIAGMIFLIFPVNNQFHDLPIEHSPLVSELAIWITGKYNMLPSLHVLLSYILYRSVCTKLSVLKRLMLKVWLVMLVASTLLSHQHHLLDLIVGFILGILIDWLWDRQKAQPLECRS